VTRRVYTLVLLLSLFFDSEDGGEVFLDGLHGVISPKIVLFIYPDTESDSEVVQINITVTYICLTTDGVSIGQCHYWPLIYTTRKYK
jgi:hypothetical protein